MTIDRDVDDDVAVRPTHHPRATTTRPSPTSWRPASGFATCWPLRASTSIVPGPFHELRPGSSVHYGGSVRMHADPAFGVLDRWNRLHDVPNVAVVDSSCFTTGPEKNPTLTAMAIAVRAADRLGRDVRDGTV